MTATPASRGKNPSLYLVGARGLFASDAAWLDALERAAHAAAPWIVVEGPGEPASIALMVRIESEADATALAASACARVRRASPRLPLYLNAIADAAPLGYDAEHWPERRIPGAAKVTALDAPGASVHSSAALANATAAGAGFAVFGAIWTSTWKDAPARGLEALTALVAAARIPILAIGGITPARVGACRRAGAAGIAVASGVLAAPDMAAAIAAYMAALAET